MPKINNWLDNPQTAASFLPDHIIKRDEVEITIARGATDLAAQCVRVVPTANGSEAGESGANNTASQAGVVVIGESDLNIKKGDLFVFRSTRYKVIYVNMSIPGMVQAVAEGTQ